MTKKINQKQKAKIVVLDANFYWTEQLFSACSEFADVLLLRPVDFRAFKKRYGSYFIDLKPKLIRKGVWEQRICCPPGWLFHYWSFTHRFFVYLIKQFQEESQLIFVFNFPYYQTLVNDLTAYSIYYSIDDYRNYWADREQQTEEIERLAITQANMTLCVASYRQKLLKQIYPAKAKQIVHIPHGCSSDFMVEQPLTKPNPLPENIKHYLRPIAGYIGALNYRFDFNYLAQVAKKMPDVNFILGGDLPQPNGGSEAWWLGVEKVKNISNIHFIGRVEHNRLGKYLQSFDLQLMVYSDCEFNLNACPTKLWDYMGTSLPIVANDVVPEVNLWSDLIFVSSNPDNFAHNIRLALTNPQWMSFERLETAKAHTWQKQAQKLYKLLRKKGGLIHQIP